jgi:YhcH/YjgK/YiaL family protein
VILDALPQATRYLAVHPGFPAAFDFMCTTDLRALAPGRHAIDGDRVYVSIDDVTGRGAAGARLEAHRRYIDIQVVLTGADRIGWRPLADCERADGPFDESRDVGFFRDAPACWLTLVPGRFVVLFPDDAHAPLGGEGALRKAVVKVAV